MLSHARKVVRQIDQLSETSLPIAVEPVGGGGQPGLEPGGGSLSQYGGPYGKETV